MIDACPTCGRVSPDWATNRLAGAKGTQRADAHIDRCTDYRAWRRTLGRHLYVTDIDQVEWRVQYGQPTPVVVLELTRLDGSHPLPQTYLDAIVTRFTKRDGQAAAIVALANRLGVDAVIVLFRHDLSEFWLFDLSSPTRWFHRDQRQYRHWITNHGGRRYD